MAVTQAERLQRAYYAATAASYDDAHLEAAEHRLALHIMLATIRHYGFESVLDVGSGTGRALTYLKHEAPALQVVGIEPSSELRTIGYRKGLTPEELRNGDALSLPFGDGSFDLVCEFSALHHIAHPARAVAEMLRVARRGIFLSDTNNFGQGRPLLRLMKQALNAARVWSCADWVKTAGRGYSVSDGDGVAYSYSVFNDWRQIRRQCQVVHVMNTSGAGINPYRTAAHVAVLGLKR
jgi:ubiquinone/menaquinone biosynthesis C-methylase UbiE